MNFKEAEAKLAEIAGGRYHCLAYKKAIYPEAQFKECAKVETECCLYVHGDGHIYGRTWDEAFKKKLEPPPIEEVPEDGAMEVPE
ncbi:MAG: hypothetical protein PHW59_14015 [Desulfobacterales bacterium]|nr:hypothetical protein [Desulfobacterales bacterium]